MDQQFSYGSKKPHELAGLSSDESAADNMNRRDFLMGIGALPIARALSNTGFPVKKRKKISSGSGNNPLRIGIIGFGFRGEQLARAAGFAHPDWIASQQEASEIDPRNASLSDFRDQQDLDIEISGIADIFDIRLERGKTVGGQATRTYKDYREMLSNPDIDAVIIATPDHWHSKMAIDAIMAGKHVYLEKCMTRTVAEAVELKKIVKNSQVVFQLGHQGRQSDLQQKARDLYLKGTLGKVTLVETTTNRNDPFGAWVWPIHEKASKNTIDWEQFQAAAEHKVTYNPERFFRWRCWWDYGTGMAGDLLTHDYDAVNNIMELGIPHSAVGSGGIYFYKDGREVPDVFNASFEYPDRNLTLIYSGTLANGISRGTMIMGSDASLELGRSLTVWADKDSNKYKSRIESGIIDPASPMVRYRPPESLAVDAMTSATSKYFADRGLMFTYRAGKRIDTTNLHLADWLHCIRQGGLPACNIDQGFQEAITAHMATLSYQMGKKVYWDPDKEKIYT